MKNTQIDENVLLRAAQIYGTPCLCYEQSEIEYWAKKLRTALPKSANIIYSVKASPNPALIKFYEKTGFYFETASEGELKILLSLNVSPEKIWISGQGKTKDYLNTAVKHKIHNFNIESVHELDLLYSLIKTDAGYNCNLRINPKNICGKSVVPAVGSAFGIDEEQIKSVLKKNSAALINGIFLYCGSQFFNTNDIVENTRYCFNLVKKIYSDTKIPIKNIDFGGGFGVPEDDSMPELDTKLLSEALDELFQHELSDATFLNETKFFFESGRYLAARTACLITQVLDIKISQGQKYLITDGGINYLGVKQKEYRLFPPHIVQLSKKIDNVENCRIVGTTCTPIDLTHPNVKLYSPEIGEYICIPDCGAYSITFSPQNFNGFYAAAEILHKGESFISIIERGSSKFPCGKREYVPIGTGSEIAQILLTACPQESDEVQNIAVVANFINLKNFSCIIYDLGTNGTDAVILSKILSKHYKISPTVVFSDAEEVSNYIEACCFPTEYFSAWSRENHSEKIFVLLVGSKNYENNVTSAIAKILKAGFSYFTKVESELIDSIEYDFYDNFLHHASQLQESFNLMTDLKSARCFMEYLRVVMENDFWRMEQNSLTEKYWGYDKTQEYGFYEHLDNEVWLNVGACNGDTILRFLKNGYNFSKIYAIDSDADALARCKSNMELFAKEDISSKISFIKAAVGNEKDQQIDELFGDIQVSLINMDIEGSENSALLGAKKVIRRDRPVLALCAYHKPEDIYTLPQTICSIVDRYIFFLRKYPNFSFQRRNSREEIVLYAIPLERSVHFKNFSDKEV